MFSRDEMQRAIEDALKTMEGVALELYRRGREESREEVEEARRLVDQLGAARDKAEAELRELQRSTGEALAQAVEWQRERDEAIKARDQYLRERDQARLAEERARESLDELDAAIYDCLPSDYDDDSPLDCVEHAADRLRALAQERDEARAEVERLRREHDEMFAELRDLSKQYDECDAFKRGAEAMREACAARIEGDGNGHYGLTGAGVAKVLRALPIPEEP